MIPPPLGAGGREAFWSSAVVFKRSRHFVLAVSDGMEATLRVPTCCCGDWGCDANLPGQTTVPAAEFCTAEQPFSTTGLANGSSELSEQVFLIVSPASEIQSLSPDFHPPHFLARSLWKGRRVSNIHRSQSLGLSCVISKMH